MLQVLEPEVLDRLPDGTVAGLGLVRVLQGSLVVDRLGSKVGLVVQVGLELERTRGEGVEVTSLLSAQDNSKASAGGSRKVSVVVLLAEVEMQGDGRSLPADLKALDVVSSNSSSLMGLAVVNGRIGQGMQAMVGFNSNSNTRTRTRTKTSGVLEQGSSRTPAGDLDLDIAADLHSSSSIALDLGAVKVEAVSGKVKGAQVLAVGLEPEREAEIITQETSSTGLAAEDGILDVVGQTGQGQGKEDALGRIQEDLCLRGAANRQARRRLGSAKTMAHQVVGEPMKQMTVWL